VLGDRARDTVPRRFKVLTPVCTLLLALLIRRGPVMRYFGVELVTASGQQAGRPRALSIVYQQAPLFHRDGSGSS
jgi:hypothetical protein